MGLCLVLDTISLPPQAQALNVPLIAQPYENLYGFQHTQTLLLFILAVKYCKKAHCSFGL